MLLFSCRGIKKSFGDKEVLRGIDLDITQGERTGIVGVNGAGKTTLAGLVFGGCKPDEGIFRWGTQNIVTGYLLQSSAFLLKKGGEESRDGAVEQDSNTLSGGERTRLSLRRLLSEKPDLLILDEPTNHLDFAGVEWLAGELSGYRGTVIVISHDRYFMDLAVNRIIELEDGLAKSYGGNYTYYRQQKRAEFEERLHRYNEQEKRKDALEAEIEKVGMWASKSHRQSTEKAKQSGNNMGAKEFYRIAAMKLDRRVKSKVKRLERIKTQGIEKPEEEVRLKFAFDDAGKHGRRILEAKDLGKGYGSRTLFSGSSFHMLHGDRIGVVGPNGCGKTTLLKIIIGEEGPDSGEIWMSASAEAVYISQDVRDLDPQKRPVDLVEGLQGMNSGSARRVFASLGIDSKMLLQKFGSLSQGERMRVKLAKAILEGSGFLILDEPTNHLDLFSRERLEDALDEYDGTILIVSHDRYMLDRICEKLLVFENGSVRPYHGRFAEYMASKDQKTAKDRADSAFQERLLIENRIVAVLGRLSTISRDDPSYPGLEEEFRELSLRRQELQS